MIGFQPNETETITRTSKPGEKEVPSTKPDVEITNPNPSSVPAPQPDTIVSSPAPEIKPIPAEHPDSPTTPEISPVQPVELS